MKPLIMMFVFLWPTICFAQDSTTSRYHSQGGRQQIGKKKQLALRAGIGIQRSFYTELGVAHHTCNYSDVGFGSSTFYTAITYMPGSNIYAFKTGYEVNSMLLAAAIEASYQTNFTQNVVVITPKAGIGLFGDVLLYYGYNFSTRRNPFVDLGKHQVSLIANVGSGFLRYH